MSRPSPRAPRWKRAVLGMALAASLLALAGALFLALDPDFGGRVSEERRRGFARAANFADGRFANQVPTPMDMDWKEMGPLLWEFLFADPGDKAPSRPLPSVRPAAPALADRDTGIARVTWLGHSTVLLELAGRKVLFDPMFGASPAPLAALAPERFPGSRPLPDGDLPALDAVIVSHDHYDHLDRGTVERLAARTARFFVPLGVGAHLERWGVPAERITEMAWGDSTSHAGMDIACAPARHFSGRGLFDRFATLWASWVVRVGGRLVYHSGDSGYGPHFRELGRRHGAFDLVMLDCGQYDPRWAGLHMHGAEAARAARELGARLLLPIHWGAFTLAMHSWYDPVERAAEAASAEGVPIATPRIGEAVPLDGRPVPTQRWWEAEARAAGAGPAEGR